MAAALSIGRQGLGRTSPNPSVGAVLVREDESGGEGGRIVGLARTGDGGRPHAEAAALAQAGEEARGATCYATLEPCAHHGRSPPCADALIAAGVARVVAAVTDPNPLVAGGGIARLRAAGVAVTEGVRRAEAERDLAGHLSVMRRARPHVALKLALSREGAIGLRGAGQVALSSPASRPFVHLMRAASDAIAVGVGTVLCDDPRLTVRLPGLCARSPVRVVFDSAARTPPGAALFSDIEAVPVVVLVGEGAPDARCGALAAAGADVVAVANGRGGRIDLGEALGALARRGVMRLMVEGGAALAEALARDDLVDEAVLIETEVGIGGADAVRPFGGLASDALAQRLALCEVTRHGTDRWCRLVRKGGREG